MLLVLPATTGTRLTIPANNTEMTSHNPEDQKSVTTSFRKGNIEKSALGSNNLGITQIVWPQIRNEPLQATTIRESLQLNPITESPTLNNVN